MKFNKKLVLHRETLRNITEREIDQVAGGTVVSDDPDECTHTHVFTCRAGCDTAW